MKENMKKIAEMMRLSIFEVFEKMFYIFLEPLNNESDEYDMEAAIRFEGSVSGEIRILLCWDIAKTMARNMLGSEEGEVSMQNMEDCSKEAVNMICGNLLGKFDTTKLFKLSIPTFNLGYSEMSLGENVCRMDFDSDGEKVGVMVEVR